MFPWLPPEAVRVVADTWARTGSVDLGIAELPAGYGAWAGVFLALRQRERRQQAYRPRSDNDNLRLCCQGFPSMGNGVPGSLFGAG